MWAQRAAHREIEWGSAGNLCHVYESNAKLYQVLFINLGRQDLSCNRYRWAERDTGKKISERIQGAIPTAAPTLPRLAGFGILLQRQPSSLKIHIHGILSDLQENDS